MSDKRKIHVYMMGSQPSVKGGMSSVVKQLLQHDWGTDMDIHYIFSFTVYYNSHLPVYIICNSYLLHI